MANFKRICADFFCSAVFLPLPLFATEEEASQRLIAFGSVSLFAADALMVVVTGRLQATKC